MMQHLKHYKRLVATAAIAGVLALSAAIPAFATDTVIQSVNPGNLSASVADLTLPAIDHSHTVETSTGTMTLTADDSTGSNAGWNVTILSSDFVWSAGSTGAVNGTDITAANFSLTSAADPVSTAGQSVSATDGPMVPATSPVGTLDSARKVVQANAGFGNGTYTQALGVSLDIPADSTSGDYTATLTTTISAAP